MVQENLFINLIFLEQLDPWLDPYYYLPNPQHDITGSGIAEAIEIYMRLKIKKICAINYKSKKTYGAHIATKKITVNMFILINSVVFIVL